jgi:predicted O-methyltransferase YrrM
MLYQIKSYFKFLLKSTNKHGVHSPFVYQLITKCFYNKTNYSVYTQLKNYKKSLLNNKNSINVNDFGAGSKNMKNNFRTISQIAKNSGTTQNRAKLLFRLVNYFKFNTILELGTSLGIATHAMSLGSPKAKITSIEGCPNISKFSEDNFKRFNLNNIEVITGDFSDEIENLKHNTYDFIFFDGNHQKKVTLQYFNTLLQTTHNDSVFIFDDIYWSKEMTEAWETIIQHPKVTVSIDTFLWGFVFLRKEQNKEHFTIRL